MIHKGDELYEGDILEADTEWCELAWDTASDAWMCQGHFGAETLQLAELAGGREVSLMGNVYEHRELITV